MQYTLEVRTTTGKKSKFIYTVFDQDKKIVSQRQSFRKYVACTIYGQFYFGRLDLIGKGDHGKQLKFIGEGTPVPIAFIQPDQVKQWNLESEFETFAEKQFNQQHPEANP
jgi:hypothetical protein